MSLKRRQPNKLEDAEPEPLIPMDDYRAAIAQGFPMIDADLTEFAFRIHDVGRLIDRHVEEFIRPHPLDHSSFMVLIVLRSYGERLPFSLLSERVLLSSGGFANAVNRLARAGLVIREADPEDRRRTYICITHAGYGLVGDLLTKYMDQFSERARSLRLDQRTDILKSLRVLMDFLQAEDSSSRT